MGSKLAKGEVKVLRFEHDFSVEAVNAAATKNLGNLPTGFIVQSVRVLEEETVTATATIALGEDGGGDADGYLVAADLAATQRGKGALVWDSTAGDEHPDEHSVAAATDGVLLTVGVANAVAGKVVVLFAGYQS